MLEYNIEFNNPPDIQYVKLTLIAIMIMILFGMLFSLFILQLVPLLCLVGISCIFLMFLWIREYVKRPKKVQIEKEGVRLIFRYSRPRFIEWGEITAIRWDSPEPNSWSNRDGMGILLIPNQTIPYCLTPAIAQEVAQAYRENTGREPPGMSLRT